jgi:hypothetical protein
VYLFNFDCHLQVAAEGVRKQHLSLPGAEPAPGHTEVGKAALDDRVPAAETTKLHQHRSPRRERLFRLARARPVRDKVMVTAAPDLIRAPLIKPAQGWRKDGDPGRSARRSATCPCREGHQRQSHDEGNYAGTILAARGARSAHIPAILIYSVGNT